MWKYGLTHLPDSKENLRNASASVGFCTILLTVIVFFSLSWQFMVWGLPQDVDFQIESATVSGLNINDSMLTGIWDFTLVGTNCNEKITVNCDMIEVSLFKHQMPYYTTNRLPSLFINTSGHNRFSFKLGLLDHYVSNRDAVEIFEEKNTRGLVTFKLYLEVLFTYRTKFWDVWDMEDAGLHLYMTCNPIQFSFSPYNDIGVFTGPSTVCYYGYYGD